MRPPKLRPSGPFAGELWHFEYFPTTTVRQLLIFDHMTVIVVLTCIPNFIKIGSRVRPPDAHNCRMFNAPLQRPLPWQLHHRGHVRHMMGCDHPSCVRVGPLVGKLWHLEYFPTWRPSAILNFKLGHACGLQTPITAECLMRHC